jgi:CRP-like cAMP-binding protein
MADVDFATLSASPVFGGLTDDELAAVVPFFKEAAFPRGTVIVREGELAGEMYYILRGAVVVTTRCGTGDEEVLATLRRGDCFGEMSLIEVAPRSATVRAVEDTTALSLTARDLQALRKTHLKTFAMIVLNIAREISRRLRRADKVLADFRSAPSAD